MVKLILIFLQILIVATVVVRTKTISSGKEFKYIGTFRSSIQEGSTQLYDEQNYYVTNSAGAWASANGDCKTVLGENATLVAIESEEEWNFLVDALQYYGSAISSTILNTQWEMGGTATDLAIDSGITQLTSDLRGVPMNMVVLTDGASNSPELTIQAAQAATSAGIRTFAVGITPSIIQSELLAIAGNDSSRVFTSANFDDLINLLAPLSQKVCPS